MHFSLGDRRETVPCRPSDAMAIALRLGAKVFANDVVLDLCAVADSDDPLADDTEQSDEQVDPDELVEEFNRFLDTLRPEDFGGETP